MSPQTYSILLAVVACMVGGAMGGYLLAYPAGALDRLGLTREAQGRGEAQARSVGAALLLAHAGAAAALGYAPMVGAAMTAALALLWFGWAAASVFDKPIRARQSAVLLAILIAASLASPFWSFGRVMLRGTLV